MDNVSNDLPQRRLVSKLEKRAYKFNHARSYIPFYCAQSDFDSGKVIKNHVTQMEWAFNFVYIYISNINKIKEPSTQNYTRHLKIEIGCR